MKRLSYRVGFRKRLRESKVAKRSMCAKARSYLHSLIFSLFLASQSVAADFLFLPNEVGARGDAEFVGATDSSLISKASLAADRSVPVFRAAALQYANYLYLSELIQKPTALIATQPKYCVDAASKYEVSSLFAKVASVREKAFWPFDCAPVRPVVARVTTSRFDLTLRYLALMPSTEWKEKFKAAAAGHPTQMSDLILQDRQIALSEAHGRSSNYFAKYNNPNFTSLMFREIAKIRQLFFEEVDREGHVQRQ